MVSVLNRIFHIGQIKFYFGYIIVFISSPSVCILIDIIWKPSSCSVLKEKRPLEGEFSPFLSINYSIKLDLFFLIGL